MARRYSRTVYVGERSYRVMNYRTYTREVWGLSNAGWSARQRQLERMNRGQAPLGRGAPRGHRNRPHAYEQAPRRWLPTPAKLPTAIVPSELRWVLEEDTEFPIEELSVHMGPSAHWTVMDRSYGAH